MTDKKDQSESDVKPVARWRLRGSLKVFGQTLPFASCSMSANFMLPCLFNHGRSQIKKIVQRPL